MKRRDLIKLGLISGMSPKAFSYIGHSEGEKMKTYDVFILGGGPAGLSAALTLGRVKRNVLLIDSGKGRNAPAEHMMNFPSRDGTPPNVFRDQIKEDLAKYKTVHITKGEVRSIEKVDNHFVINKEFLAHKILLAHGIKDILPSIQGLKSHWGKSVFHCPFCHGFEFSEKSVAVLGDKDYALHMIPMMKPITTDIIYFPDNSQITDMSEVEAMGVKVIKGKVKSVLEKDGKFSGLVLSSGEEIPREGLLIRPGMELTSQIGQNLGCLLTKTGHYQVDSFGQTSVSGVYAAGDISEMRQSVLISCSSGMIAGSSIHFALASDESTHSH